MSRRRTLVSVDLDGIGCYHAIHGLPPPSPGEAGMVLERCLPRFLALFDELDVRATFFVIGHELEASPQGAAVLRAALAAGHELGNHSHAHAYDLSRWSAHAQLEDLARCDAALRAIGADPIGFRAPGYSHDARLLASVDALGYRYDTSALPSPTYYLAKLGAMALHALAGRRSHSLARGAGSFLGPREDHDIAGTALRELPISAMGPLRLPLVGTFLLAGPRWPRQTLREASLASARVHLELHGLDLADERDDALSPTLRRVQPELRTPLAIRRERLASWLRARGGAVALRDAIERV
ncbi:MAG: polysaccharide deacetylase family protein [Deltaproteobacteria bacterium]|nr:polysaccharide deacetylase family protein [Deltaproteobacteria bacterium]